MPGSIHSKCLFLCVWFFALLVALKNFHLYRFYHLTMVDLFSPEGKVIIRNDERLMSKPFIDVTGDDRNFFSIPKKKDRKKKGTSLSRSSSSNPRPRKRNHFSVTQCARPCVIAGCHVTSENVG